jgi:hypothetical protein
MPYNQGRVWTKILREGEGKKNIFKNLHATKSTKYSFTSKVKSVKTNKKIVKK